MIKEDYVSVETAKLLKEKGFDWEVHRSYLVNSSCFAPADINDLPYRKDAIRIPTLQMAMKWLREVHKKLIEVCADRSQDFKSIVFRPSIYNAQDLYYLWGSDGFLSYEQATEAAIKYCLENLI